MKTKQNLLLALLLVLLQALPALAGNGEKALLWQVSGKGLKQPSYIYGTIHMLCPDKMHIPAALQERVKNTERLALELDMDDPNMTSKMMQQLQLPAGQSLKALFASEAEYTAVSDYFRSAFGVELQQLDQMKPFMLQTMLSMHMAGCQPESYEQKLTDLAVAQQKEVIGLETVEEQMAALDKLPGSFFVNSLVRSVNDVPQAKAEYTELVKLYLAQDLDGMVALSEKTMTKEELEQFYQVLLTQRNKNWVPQIELLAKEKPTLFAVGAMHLPGKEGVLELLRKQGYKVTPVLK